MDQYTNSTQLTFVGAENIAYNARKVVEGIAFACVVALDHVGKGVSKVNGTRTKFSSDCSPKG